MDALLTRLAQSVSGADDLEGLTRPLLELLQTITGMESTYLTRIDEAAGLQHILYSRNTRQMQIPEGLSVPWADTLCKRALEEGRPYTDDVGACWGDSDAAKALGIKTYLSQPVRNLDGGVYGTLCAASDQTVAIPNGTVEILAMFARLISLQVERERLLQSLRRANAELTMDALIDPLTGIANRRALLQELRRVLARAKRDGTTVQAAFIDLNGFKAINDRHGHDAGDRFLIHIAHQLSAGLREDDLVARFGGDEFVVIAAGSDPRELRERLERLTSGRYEGNGLSIDYGSASVGVAESLPGETDPEQLLGRADAAMYEIKRGRPKAR